MQRLFGNENSQHAPRSPDDNWESEQIANRTAGVRAAQQLNPGAGEQSFPYPQTYVINFAVAQAVELWVPVDGFVLSFWDSTNITDIVNVRMALAQGDVSGKPLPFRPGHALGLGTFTWLGLTWAQIAGAVGTLAILPQGVILDENH